MAGFSDPTASGGRFSVAFFFAHEPHRPKFSDFVEVSACDQKRGMPRTIGKSRASNRCTARGKAMAKKTKGSEDQNVLNHINRLVEEEEQLLGKDQLADGDESRLAELKVQLDQCWDLLRQRRALREFGKDPDQAKVRPPKIVESYEQ
jgi:hypothetical protein